MIDITCAIFFAIPLILLIVALLVLPGYVSKQNQKAFDYLKENHDLSKQQMESDRKRELDKTRISVTLQAFERMTLFLERIYPANLITRANFSGQKVSGLAALLQKTVRDEYEHNMSQQLYITTATWNQIIKAKEEVLIMINQAAGQVTDEKDSGAFAKALLTSGFPSKTDPINIALDSLKKELKETF